MEWVETTGKTLEQAKEAALEQLGVAEGDAEFVVIQEPRPGLFGRWRGEARVRARVRPTRPRPKRSHDRRRRQRYNGGRERGSTALEVRDEGQDEPVAARSSGPGALVVSPPEGEQNGKLAGSPGGNRRRRNRGRGRSHRNSGSVRTGEATSQVPASSAAADVDGHDARPVDQRDLEMPRGAATDVVVESDHGRQGEGTVVEVNGAEQAELSVRFLEGLLEAMGIPATVRGAYEAERGVVLEIQGEGLGPLVGPAGATMAALQEVARAHLQRQTKGQSERLVLDVAGYRARRVAALERFTRQVAEEVLRTGEARALEPMSAADRKVVHDTVAAMQGVTTRSEGEEPRRFTVIVPAGDAEQAS